MNHKVITNIFNYKIYFSINLFCDLIKLIIFVEIITMKTAMQELIDTFKEYQLEWDLPIEAIDEAESMLEKEKEQIINAYNHNMTGFDKLQQEEIGLNWAEDYYNETYQNK